MFEQNYKDAMNEVTPDTNLKDRILEKITSEENHRERRNPAMPWRIAFACVAAVAIVLGVIFVPRSNIDITGDNSPQTLKVSKSYNEIYDLIKPKFSISGWVNVYGAKGSDTEYIIEENMEGAAVAGTGATNGTASKENSDDFSTTTEQVDGVNEADIVKTDGKHIYSLIGGTLNIYKAAGKNSALLSSIELSKDEYDTVGDMFLNGDKLIILKPNDYPKTAAGEKKAESTDDTASTSAYESTNGILNSSYDNYVTVLIYDISNPEKPEMISQNSQKGWYKTSRMVGNYIYLVSESSIAVNAIDKGDPTTFVPTTIINGKCEAVPAESIYRYDTDTYERSYTVICAYDCTDGKMTDTVSLLGGTGNLYCSTGNIILTTTNFNPLDDNTESTVSQHSTVISRLEISDGKIEYKTSGEIDGILENQFYIDEYNGYFRFVTTVTKATQTIEKFANTDEDIVSYSNETSAKLTVTDGNFKTVGKIENLAPGERVYSVRFMGDIAYFVTFRQTDPLFSADLSDPNNPKILGELKISGFSEYMYPYGDGLLFGFGMEANEQTGRTTFLKLSMFDISDPLGVTEQDKTVLDGYGFSPALYDHKSILVSESKNLIGFTAYDTYGNVRYMVYNHTDGAFNRLAVLEPLLDENKLYNEYVRGLFINDSFYLVSQKGLQIFDMNTFLQTATVVL